MLVGSTKQQIFLGNEGCALKDNKDWPKRKGRMYLPGKDNSILWFGHPGLWGSQGNAVYDGKR